ncbi:aminotransferase [Rhodophyticola porphyridii]|uniref:aspartate transaminase n=1 Tax=Rhodophyticola porphyridii TaxID=1852017 RepID=A0A3L9XZH2_9RHOB|nr:aminotransferase [Rhodophyticola porphyridii]RMA42011.1 aminotransferase [Rhodophyticola porphyridii]
MVGTPINPRYARTIAPPVMEARRWIDGVSFPEDRPLINLSQAAPVSPPPEPLREAMAEALLNRPESHLYGPVLGLPELRAELAGQWSTAYGGTIRPDQVAVTAGCNQAFTATLSTIAGAGDAVILPTPWYFNHKMWLDMEGVEARLLATGDDLIPDPEAAAALVCARTRAIILVSPNNPGGVEYPAPVLRAFRDLAKRHGLALILDETYRDFHSQTGAPHDLFADPDWDETLIHLYSFSKAYRLTGHRVGAVMASPARLVEVEKFLDTVAICPPQIGQIGALWGMRNLGGWLAGERMEILRRRDALIAGFQRLPGWQLMGCGAYFAYARHPFDLPSDAVAQALVGKAGILVLPGTMFGPTRAEGGDGQAEASLRIAFANADAEGLAQVVDRLAGVTL